MSLAETQVLRTVIKPKFYLDSVALMRHSQAIASGSGVVEAAMMMATPANIQIMINAGLLSAEEHSLDGGDLIVSVLAQSGSDADAALRVADDLLTQQSQVGQTDQWKPRSLRSAIQSAPNANLALISVPGEFAVSEARKAIRRGLNAMIFSDNVALDAEVQLKQEARDCGRLVMGPDCGTAIINGVPLAFANRVPRGDIGIIGASGTGIQEVSCLLANAGCGVSHAIGVGGRDLSQEVGGISTLQALAMLESDQPTTQIVLISKPPAQAVSQVIVNAIAESNKPFVVCFIGAHEKPADLPPNAQWATSLKSAAELAAGKTLFGNAPDAETQARHLTRPGGNRIAGLFAGGTLCAEAQVILSSNGHVCESNAPIPGITRLTDSTDSHVHHHLVDLGADEYTKGRPHPMIEPAVRDTPLLEVVQDKTVSVVVLDLVIGFGAHGNPAAHLVQSLEKVDNRPLIVASVTGTEEDPQIRSQQVRLLESAGIVVAPSNADAVELAVKAIT